MAESGRNIPSQFHVWMQFYAQLNAPPSFHLLGAFSSFISRHFNASISTLRCSVLYLIRRQFISSFNQIIASAIPVFTTFLQLKYQGNDQNKSPFLTHPRAMRVAVSSLVLYYLAYMALLRYPLRHFSVVAHHCLVSSGYVSVASLASVLLPNSFSPFVYAVFVLLSASELLYSLYHKLVAEEDYRRRLKRFLSNIFRVVGNYSRQRAQILPL